jgi:cobalt/nickel transport system permease protein
MIRETFTYGDSPIHRLDPRLKIVFATVFSFTVAVSEGFDTLTAALTASSLLVALGRFKSSQVAKRLFVVNGLILFLWLIIPWTFKGEPLFRIGPLTVTQEGVLLAARISIKSNAIVLAFIALVASTSITKLGHALDCLRLPAKIVHLLLMTYRYIFVILDEYERLVRSARIRGFEPRTNMHTYKTYAYLIGMLFVRAAARAERVQQAMLCRGFKGKYYCLSRFSFSRLDWIALALMGAVVTSLIVIEWAQIT